VSRHGGSHTAQGLSVYQIEVLDFSKRKQGYSNYSRSLFRDTDGTIKKTADTLPEIPCRTIVDRFKNYKAALRFGRRLGTVKECRKVDYERYLNNQEHLRLNQQPTAIEIDREEFEVESIDNK
jgi:hypothetical protein